MRLLRLPPRVSRVAVLGVMSSVVALSAFVTYERFVNRNPMRLKRDADGIWRWLSMEEYLVEQVERAKERLKADPTDQGALRRCAAYAVALHEERRKLQEEGRATTTEAGPPLTL